MVTTSNPTNPEVPAQELITKSELARRLKLCNRMVEIMANDGRIPVVRIGRSVRFNWNAVLQTLSEPSATK